MNPFPNHPLPLYVVGLDVATPFRGRILEPGAYVVDHVLLSMLSAYAVPGSVTSMVSEDSEGEDPVVLVMPGVYGDLLMLTAIKGIENMTVACLPEYASILEGVAPTTALPCPYKPGTHYVNLSHLTERPEVLGRCFTDGLRDMGFAVKDELKYEPSVEELDFASDAFTSTRVATRIAIQPFASARCRTYPHMGELLTEIDKAFDPVPEILILCDQHLEIPDAVKHRVVQTADYGCTLRQSIAMMTTAHVLVCPDSVFQHVAGALNIPTVAMFGPFHWSERVLNHDAVLAVQGLADCGPCRHHAGSSQGRNYPDDPRCTVLTTGFCKAMASIKPERVVAAIKQVLRRADKI